MARLCLTADDFLNHNTIFGIQTIVCAFQAWMNNVLIRVAHFGPLLFGDGKGPNGRYGLANVGYRFEDGHCCEYHTL